jgi:hypothetical protein
MAVGTDKAVIFQAESIGLVLGKAKAENLFALNHTNLAPEPLATGFGFADGTLSQPKTTITFSRETISSTTRMVGTAWAGSPRGAIHWPCQLSKKALISAGRLRSGWTIWMPSSGKRGGQSALDFTPVAIPMPTKSIAITRTAMIEVKKRRGSLLMATMFPWMEGAVEFEYFNYIMRTFLGKSRAIRLHIPSGFS